MPLVNSQAYLDTRVSLFVPRLQARDWFEQQARVAVEAPAEATIEDILAQMHVQAEGIDPELLAQQSGSLMLATFLHEFLVLLRPMGGMSRRLLMQWIKRLELRNLKAILRGILKQRPVHEIREELVDLGALTTLPFEQLLRSDDIPELLRALDKTGYASTSRQARRLFEEHNDPFFVDASIDQRYFNDIANSVAQITGPDRAALQQLMGSIIDQHNLLWLLRYRFTYGLRPAETWYLLMPGGLFLPTSRLLPLVGLESAAAVHEQLPASLQQILDGAQTPFIMEQRLERHVIDIAWRHVRQHRAVLARALAWLVLREKQLLQVLALFKGKSLSLDASLIRLGMRLGPVPGIDLPPEGGG